jgi:very-short-patch-repair endonuclease
MIERKRQRPLSPLDKGERQGEGVRLRKIPSRREFIYSCLMAKSKPIASARRLRQRATPAETKVWALLRTRPETLKFRRQHPVGPYVADFACAPAKLIIELDGGSHITPAQRQYDANRTAYMQSEGWTVLRFWNPQTHDELDAIVSAIVAHAATLAQGRKPLT